MANVPDEGDEANARDGDSNNNKAATAATTALPQNMFFTTSNLIERMNLAIKDSNDEISKAASNSLDDSEGGRKPGGFELQMKMPDGSYRRAEKKEIAAADFQSKMKQASERIVGFDSLQKIEWAKCQRLAGNELFSKGEYLQAMDVYLTCLVAMDQNCSGATVNDEKATLKSSQDDGLSENRQLHVQMERELKLPVLLNLAICSTKMGMLSKAEKFCDFAVESVLGKQSTKAYFCRGRARMLMGKYASAESDLNNAMKILEAKVCMSDKIRNLDLKDYEDEKAVILREKLKLQKLVRRAEKNRNQQKKAMEKVFKQDPKECCQHLPVDDTRRTSLYPEKKGFTKDLPLLQSNGNEDNTAEEGCQPTYFQWYLRMIGRCAQKILDIVGDDSEENEGVYVPVDQDLLNTLMACKKVE